MVRSGRRRAASQRSSARSASSSTAARAPRRVTMRVRRPESRRSRAAPREDVGFDGGELLLRDLAELQPHLCRQQLFPQNAVVVELAVDGGGDLAEHELDAADQQRVENDHGSASPGPATAAITAASAY